MSMLLFHVGEERYVIDYSLIVRVIPQIKLHALINSPSYLEGFLLIENHSIPVINFCWLIANRKARFALDTRIILLHPKEKSSKSCMFGILGEKITELIDLTLAEFLPAEFSTRKISFIDKIYQDQKGMIQHVDIENLFLTLVKNGI
jgi:chemotaxis-related protein WspB